MKKILLGLVLAVGMVFGQSAPAGYVSVPFGASTVVVPTVATMAQNTVTQMEDESILALTGEGMVNTQSVVSNLNAVVTNYCNLWPTLTSCDSAADIATALAPYVTQLQTAFALVPASQWNPSTFTTSTYVNAIGFLNAANTTPSGSTTPTTPTSIVNTATCVTITGINSTGGVECEANVGVTLAQVKALNGYVVQNGVLYKVVIENELMGTTYLFFPMTPSN